MRRVVQRAWEVMLEKYRVRAGTAVRHHATGAFPEVLQPPSDSAADYRAAMLAKWLIEP
jgi:hypothetical protein